MCCKRAVPPGVARRDMNQAPSPVKTLACLCAAMALMFPMHAVHAQDNEFTPVNALLEYREVEVVEEAPKSKPRCGGGGLVGAVNCEVTARIEGGGPDAPQDGESRYTEVETGAASAQFALTPVLLPIPDNSLFQVRFRIEGGSVSVRGEIDGDARAEAESDTRQVRERLRRHRVNLDERQVARLRAGDSVDIPVESPFLGLQRLVLQAPVTASVYLPSDDIVRSIDFMGRDPASLGGPGGAEIALAVIDPETPFRLHVTYDSPPSTPPLSILLRWPGGSQRVGLSPTGDPQAFTSQWYVVDAASVRGSREGSRLLGSADPMPAGTAELFAGEWHVTHSGGPIGEASGIAHVAPGGDPIRLFLDAGGQAGRYESIEVVGTRDREGGNHTLDVRFIRKGEGEGWGPPLSHRAPQGNALFVPDGTREMRAELRNARAQVDVQLREAGDQFRVMLANRGQRALRLSGPWNREKDDGSLQGEGQQTWGQMPRIDGVVVLEEQRPRPTKLGNFAEFLEDGSPAPSEYIFRPGPDDANRTTDYPFRDDAQNDTTYRTLFVYGRNLPQRGSDAMNLSSGDERVSYELRAFPGEGNDALFERGRRKRAENRDHYSNSGTATGDVTELVLTARFTEGVLPGAKSLGINTARGFWALEFADANVFPQFSHRWREDFQTEVGEFSPTEIAYLGNNVYVTLEEQTRLPQDSLELRLSVNGESPIELTATRSGTKGEPAFVTPPLRILRRSLYEEQEAPAEVDGARVVLADEGDRLVAEVVNPYLVRAIPVKVAAQVVPGPSDRTLWKSALQRVAACHGESNIDIQGFTNEESDTYSKFIMTENLGQMASPLLFGALRTRDIEISKGDHAAAILIRDQFLQNLNNTIPELISTINDDEKMWQFYQTRAASKMPFWNLVNVEGPGEGMQSELGAFLSEFGLQASEVLVSDFVRDMARRGGDMLRGDTERPAGTWPIGTLVDSVTTNPEAFGNSQRHAHLYAFRKTREALQRLVDSASNAYARASNAGDCDVEELLLIAGQDEPGIVASILPRLVRPVENGSEAWEPDFTAQAYVGSLHVKGEAIRALDAYARIDEAYQAMALAVVTAGAAAALTAGGAALAGAYLMMAVDVADMALYGSTEFSRYLDSQPLVDYAVGATAGGFSEGFYDEAMAMRTEGWEAAAALLGPALGAGTGIFDVSDALKVRRGARVMDDIETLDRATIEALSEPDQRALASYFADLESRKPVGLPGQADSPARTHDAAEAADFEKFARYMSDNGVDVTGPGVRPLGDSSETSGGATSSLDDLFGEPSTATRADPLADAPPTVRVSEDPQTGTARVNRAEHEDVPIARTSDEPDITDPGEGLVPDGRTVADDSNAPVDAPARDPPIDTASTDHTPVVRPPTDPVPVNRAETEALPLERGTTQPSPISDPATPPVARDGPGGTEVIPRDGPGGTQPIPRDGPGGTEVIPRDGPGGTQPIPRDGPGGTEVIPRDGPGGTQPIPRDGPGGTQPLTTDGPGGTSASPGEGIPPTIPPRDAPAAAGSGTSSSYSPIYSEQPPYPSSSDLPAGWPDEARGGPGGRPLLPESPPQIRWPSSQAEAEAIRTQYLGRPDLPVPADQAAPLRLDRKWLDLSIPRVDGSASIPNADAPDLVPEMPPRFTSGPDDERLLLDGRPVETGRLLNADPRKGAFADVYDLLDEAGEEMGFVRKVYGERRNSKGELTLDTPAKAQAMVEDSAHGAALLQDAGIPQLEILYVNKDGTPPTLVQRKLGHHMPEGVEAEHFASELIDPRTGRLPRDVQEAVLALKRKLWENGIFWEDAHLGNVMIQEVRGPDGTITYRAGITDTDRIDLFASPRTGAEPDAWLRAYQVDPMNNGIMSRNPGDPITSAQEAMLATLEHKGHLEYDVLTGELRSPDYRGYDADLVKKYFPMYELPEDLRRPPPPPDGAQLWRPAQPLHRGIGRGPPGPAESFQQAA